MIYHYSKSNPHRRRGLLRRVLDWLHHQRSRRASVIELNVSRGSFRRRAEKQPSLQVLYCACGRPSCRLMILAIHHAQLTITADGCPVPYVAFDAESARQLIADLARFLDQPKDQD